MANVGGQEYGPFTWDQMLNMAAEGRVTPELPIRKASDPQWSVAASIPGLLGGARSAPAKAAAHAAVRSSTPASQLKKARPLAPAGRPLPPVVVPPQNIPTGIPVGSPVGTAASVITPASPSGPFSFEVAASPSGKARTVKSVLDDDEKVGVQRKNNTALIVGILGGVTALVAVLVALTIFITMNRGSEDEKLAATNISSSAKDSGEEGGEANPGEENPPGAEGEGPSKEKKSTVVIASKAKTETKATRPDTGPQLAALKSIHKWGNGATLKSVIIGNAKISISRIWLAADAGGKSARLAEPLPSTTAETATEDSSKVAGAEFGAESPKFVFVEVAVANKAGSPLKYKGWNIAKSKVPFMADDQDRILKLVPSSETPGVARLTKADVPGGGAISDILVFEAPSEPFEALRLVLPQNVFYDNTKNPYTGIEFTLDVLGNEGGPPVAVPPAAGIATDAGNDPLVSGRKVPSESAKPDGLSPAETTKPEPAKKPEPPPKKPSLIDEINRFEEPTKTKKMDEGKGTEPAKPATPAKKTAPKPAKAKGKG